MITGRRRKATTVGPATGTGSQKGNKINETLTCRENLVQKINNQAKKFVKTKSKTIFLFHEQKMKPRKQKVKVII